MADRLDREAEAILRRLVTEQRVGALAVSIDGAPFASLVPFALSEHLDAALIHASELARHSKGLGTDASVSLLIHQSDHQPEINPAQLARVTLQCKVAPLERGGESYLEAKRCYLKKFPKSEITFQLGDFTLYRLEIVSGRFVAGFARTFDLGPADLRRISGLS